MIWGRVICTLLGFLVAKYLGAALGFVLGYFFDKGLQQHFFLKDLFSNPDQRQKNQAVFFKATFTVMGHVAKSDGSISADEIKHIENMMRQFHIQDHARTQAIEYFNQGKDKSFNLDLMLSELRSACKKHKALLQVFVEFQVQAAYVNGLLAEQKRAILIYVSERLGLDRTFFARINNMYQAEDKFREYQRQHYQHTFQKMRNNNAVLEAYKILGVESNVSDVQLKKAYRKLISLHHPDRLIAQGLPEEMIKLTTEKTQEIQKAYETIMEERNRGKVV